MHDAQVKEVEQQEVKEGKKRKFGYFVVVKHRLLIADLSRPHLEFLSFADKKSMREELALAKYDGTALQIVRGYEMKVQTNRHISIN